MLEECEPNQLWRRSGYLRRLATPSAIAPRWKPGPGRPGSKSASRKNPALALHGCFAEDVPRREAVLCHDKASGFRASQSKAGGGRSPSMIGASKAQMVGADGIAAPLRHA